MSGFKRKQNRFKQPTISVLSLGGGVQSSTIAEMVAEGDMPIPDLVIFADTGDEPDYVYDQVEYLKGRLFGLCEFRTVSGGDIIDDLVSPEATFLSIPAHLAYNGKRSILKRECTSHYKILPIRKAIKNYLVTQDHARVDSRGTVLYTYVSVDMWLGISYDEIDRMRKSRVRRFVNSWPLIDRKITRDDCIEYLSSRGLPVPKKSSCVICPFHGIGDWQNMKKNRPDDFNHAIEIDEFIRDGNKYGTLDNDLVFIHRNAIPVRDVDLNGYDDLDLISSGCDAGYCFV